MGGQNGQAGKFLYAIRIYPPAQGGFNLCPADICQEDAAGGAAQEGDAGPDFAFCPASEETRRTMTIEGYTPPKEVIDSVLRIAREASLDIGGVEYLVNDRDGEVYYYDINALSNFVTDASNIVGFDPFPRFADFIEAKMQVYSKV